MRLKDKKQFSFACVHLTFFLEMSFLRNVCEVAETGFELCFYKTPNPGLPCQAVWVHILAPPLPSCVNLGKLLNLFHSQ